MKIPHKNKLTGKIFRSIPANLVDAEKKAAIRNNKSLDGVAGAIYDDFFKKSESSVDKILVKASDKKMGRKIK